MFLFIEYHAGDKKIGCGSCETDTFIMETKYCKQCEGCLVCET